MQDRPTLKYFFRRGATPTAKQFADLIDSLFHLTEDGIEKETVNGQPSLTVKQPLTVTQPCRMEDKLHIHGDLVVDGDIFLPDSPAASVMIAGENQPSSLPAGSIILWQGSHLPPGWRVCDGSDGMPDLSGLQQLFNQYQPGIRFISRQTVPEPV